MLNQLLFPSTHFLPEQDKQMTHFTQWYFLCFFLEFPRPNLITGLSGWRAPDQPRRTQEPDRRTKLIYSRFWYVFSLFLKKIHSVKLSNSNFCKQGRAWFAEISSQNVSKRYSILFSAKFEPFSKPFRGRARWTCGNKILHDVAGVVPTPPNGGEFFGEFQHGKSMSDGLYSHSSYSTNTAPWASTIPSKPCRCPMDPCVGVFDTNPLLYSVALPA